MEKDQTENQRLVKASREHYRPHSAYGVVISEWVLKFALNARQELDDLALQAYQQLWESAFADVGVEALTVAFNRTLRQCKFMPTVADVLAHVETAKMSAREEQAERKWQEVLEYIRLHFHPDLSIQSGPRISERTRRAISAAGGLAYISESDSEAKQWAKKRFIEAYLRWDELERDYAMLPDSEFKTGLKALAEAKSMPQLPERSRLSSL